MQHRLALSLLLRRVARSRRGRGGVRERVVAATHPPHHHTSITHVCMGQSLSYLPCVPSYTLPEDGVQAEQQEGYHQQHDNITYDSDGDGDGDQHNPPLPPKEVIGAASGSGSKSLKLQKSMSLHHTSQLFCTLHHSCLYLTSQQHLLRYHLQIPLLLQHQP